MRYELGKLAAFFKVGKTTPIVQVLFFFIVLLEVEGEQRFENEV
jgi:hypothetical protein